MRFLFGMKQNAPKKVLEPQDTFVNSHIVHLQTITELTTNENEIIQKD